MNEQQLIALVPALGAVLEGYDFEVRVSACMTLLLHQIVNNKHLADPMGFARILGHGLVTSVHHAQHIEEAARAEVRPQ